jgi:hypothetical protein
MGVVYGLAGLRDHSGRLSFRPNKKVRHLRFHLSVRGQLLAVEITTNGATYNLGTGRRPDGLPQGRWICGRGNRLAGPEIALSSVVIPEGAARDRACAR